MEPQKSNLKIYEPKTITEILQSSETDPKTNAVKVYLPSNPTSPQVNPVKVFMPTSDSNKQLEPHE